VYFYNFPIISILQNVLIYVNANLINVISCQFELFWYFPVLFGNMVSQSFASLVTTVEAAEFAIGLTISFLLFGSKVLLPLVHP
jgi:NADH:ubiquinone oxidoreductase subunit K